MKTAKEKLIALGKKLSKMGFTLSWDDPFSCWVSGKDCTPFLNSPPPDYEYIRLFVVDPPIPKLTPFDMVSIMLSNDPFDMLYFEICVYYSSVLEGLLEPEEFEELWIKTDGIWAGEIYSYLSSLIQKYNMDTDVEHDDPICYSIYKNFHKDKWDDVLDIMSSLKVLKHNYDEYLNSV